MSDLRECERLEILDAIGTYRYDPSDFGYLLMNLMGFMKLSKVRIFGHFYNNDLVFIASSSPLRSGTKILCGVGMLKYEASYTKRERLEIARFMIKELILNDPECQRFVCYVKGVNTNVLQMWRLIGKLFKDELTVSVTPTEIPKGDYQLVVIERVGKVASETSEANEVSGA